MRKRLVPLIDSGGPSRVSKATPEWIRKACCEGVPPAALERMQHLRRLMLIHSCCYYQLSDTLVDDHTWYAWAQELLHFHCVYGEVIGFYDTLFAGWEGFTGFYLRYDNDVVRVAKRLLADRDRRAKGLPNELELKYRLRFSTPKQQ